MRRGRALLLTAMWLVGQFSALAHVVFVTHATCPEHGEPIHPTGPSGDHAAPGTAIYETTAAAEGGHADHCAAAYQAPRAPSDRVEVAAVHAVSLPLPVAAAAEPASPSELYRLAPKTSPPA